MYLSKTYKSIKSESLQLKRGMQLGKYRLIKQLDMGGACEVWKARDQVEGILVALKVPLVGADGRRDNDVLIREIRAVSQLRHPNILSVKNADIIDGHVVLATELSTGTLDDCSRPMSVARIISIIMQVLEGLTHAHRHRIVHCDVTPGNIFLFPDKRAALGDFGISLKLAGRIRTIDDFGTPGYVAPEQAYGRPTYRSDCFSAALILYEYITGFLPRWPFEWPFRNQKRLQEKTGSAYVKFMKKALTVNPEQRFASAGQMKKALVESLPKARKMAFQNSALLKQTDWRRARREAFVNRYRKVFTTILRCSGCDEPITENMVICPWCGSDRNRFDARTRFDFVCPRCRRGVLPEWHFCPWCYGPGFKSPAAHHAKDAAYHARCTHCHGKLMRFMRYCPWCHRKVRRHWDVHPFPEVCSRCGWSVDTNFWSYCPWCRTDLRI